MFAQQDLFQQGLFGLKGVVTKATVRDDDSLCAVTFQGAGNHIVEKCDLELIDA